MKKAKVFIAGHNGMVGSALHNFLKKSNIGSIITASRSKLDLTDPSEVKNFIKKNKPDVVINCAGKVGGIMANYNYPTEFLFENIKIQMNLMNSCFDNNIKNVILLGSSCIYPKFAKQPIKEDYLLSGKLEPTNEPYALAKIVGLKSLEYYNRQFNTNYLALQPTNLYGPNDNFHSLNSHFIPGLIKKFHATNLNKKKIVEVWGTGKAKRDMMYVYDLADAICFILKKLLKKDKKLNKIIKRTSFINVGTGIEHSVKFYVSKIKKVVNPQAKIKFNSKFPDGTPRKLLNCKIMRELGWKSETSLETGLIKTYNWYLNNHKK